MTTINFLYYHGNISIIVSTTNNAPILFNKTCLTEKYQSVICDKT